MPDLIVLRLHPVKPTSGTEFTKYLEGSSGLPADNLQITVKDLSVGDPADGTQVGQATYVPPPPPSSPFPPPIPPPDPNTDIVQHEHLDWTAFLPQPALAAAATAVIVLQPPAREYQFGDLRLEIQRNGKTIVDRTIDYNADILTRALPAKDQYPTFTTLTSTYVPLPPPDAELDPNVAHVDLSDGMPPNFDDLHAEVDKVLAQDPGPGNPPQLGQLSAQQCRHVAREIVWNRRLDPLPAPSSPLATLYTEPEASSNDSKRDRQIFESDLLAYYNTQEGKAKQISQYVFALNAAIACEDMSNGATPAGKSAGATQAGLRFPVHPSTPANNVRVTEAKVVLDGLGEANAAGGTNPAFTVPAPFFYALGAGLPLQVTPERRYQIATLENEQHVLETLANAIELGTVTSPAGGTINEAQAARRLRSLGEAQAKVPHYPLSRDANGDVSHVVNEWLNFLPPGTPPDANISVFWSAEVATPAGGLGHLELVLYALTDGYQPPGGVVTDPFGSFGSLMNAISAIPVGNVEQLAGMPSDQWHGIFIPNPDLLPPFTLPGSIEERTTAFIRHLRHFLTVGLSPTTPPPPSADTPPTLDRSGMDPLVRFADRYKARSGQDFAFGTSWDENASQLATVKLAIEDVFPDDPPARSWLEQVLRAVEALYQLADAAGQPDLRFSIMEALYARGFTSKSVGAASLEDFAEALTGTIAYEYASNIYAKAKPDSILRPEAEDFRPVNPDGCLVNCIPPDYLSPLGPVAYLHEMLKVSRASTCDAPLPKGDGYQLGDILAPRRGPVGELLATHANLNTPLPLVDLVNECLENMVIGVPARIIGAVYDTNPDELGGHKLRADGADPAADQHDEFRHDPTTLFETLPEHSSPATPVKQQGAYDKLRGDFSSPLLPYSQPLDVSRSYLRQLGTSRYAAMRRFRENVTEFVLNPDPEPADFQSHRWRYPVRIEIAREYLHITPEECDLLFTHDIVTTPTSDRLLLRELYGFAADTVDGTPWRQVVVRAPEFLERTGLTYREFLDLWRSEFVEFRRAGEDAAFPECEPCCLDDYAIEFVAPHDTDEALKRLTVFIRLWRKLRDVSGARYTFAQLRDICNVLQLFQGGSINADFVRQLAAFQMLRDDFELRLDDRFDRPVGTVDENRTHILALWVGTSAAKWEWAVEHLLDQVRHHAQAAHPNVEYDPDFIRLLARNLDPLSRLAGFDPAQPSGTWHALPTHTLRFAEVLEKVCASDFGVGEILFLFTADEHLQGDDPFPLQSENEALDLPFDFPDDAGEHSLWALRRKLLEVHVSDEEAAAWTWLQIEASLREEFGLPTPPTGTPDPLMSLGEHFFPNVLEAAGHVVDAARRQYRVSLVGTSAGMWNTPEPNPFRYDAGASELRTQVPLQDEEVAAFLGSIRPLRADEQTAVLNLYALPRKDLAPFAFIFANFGEAQERLIREDDEDERWSFFQREFARFYKRSRVIVTHLADHVADATGSPSEEGYGLAWLLLRHLFADENMAKSSWEGDNGQVPNVTWVSPNGGAFAGLLGLSGTGLLGEFTFDSEAGSLAWREARGPMAAFGPFRNRWNAPVPTILPSMDLTLTPGQERSVELRNGFALGDEDGTPLGGAQGFGVRWNGVLLVEREGDYAFFAGAPTPDGERPDFEVAEHRRWRVRLERGQKTWVLLGHNWPHSHSPHGHTNSMPLRRGAYHITVEFVQPPPGFSGPDDTFRQHTGFQLKYSGPDSDDRPVAIPVERLFVDTKDATLGKDVKLADAPKDSLDLRFTSTLRDIRRTYQRAFKALLFAHRFCLSAEYAAGYRQSEIGYMLAHPGHPQGFAGASYYRDGAVFKQHLAYFDFNFLPVKDSYRSPTGDQRAEPSDRREQALFDWWERVYDYTLVRREARSGRERPDRERPAWLLFEEAAEGQPDNPAQLLRHIGVNLDRAPLMLRYHPGYDLASDDLEDERWLVRVWQGNRWVRELIERFAALNIRLARCDLWVADDPIASPVAPETESGNQNLTKFVRDGSFENGEPRRYVDVKRLNDGLRERARRALLAYLCGLYRVAPKVLSDFLLLDVEAGICEKACRIEEAITAAQTYVQRHRLGLEQVDALPPPFVLLWDRRFATFHTWQACKRREIYRENWIDWDEIEEARRTEAFRLLESELRQATLAVPVPGGLEYWPNQRPPTHAGLELLQERDPSHFRQLAPPPENLGLRSTPERHARPSWLAELRGNGAGTPPSPPNFETQSANLSPNGQQGEAQKVPLWIQAAVRLGVRFLRVAAAAEPPASAAFEPKESGAHTGCCRECGLPHPALVDEYYFWLLDSRLYEAVTQDANTGLVDPSTNGLVSWWHQSDQLPKLLGWPSKSMVHLAWCRVHNGEFQPPQRSSEGVRISPGQASELEFHGRTADSLTFEVTGTTPPVGYADPSKPGFRYDIATDTAVTLPLLVASSLTPEPPVPGGLHAYPYFAYHEPGARLFPATMFGPAVAVAGALRMHCRFEAALKWYALAFDPLRRDCAWAECDREDGSGYPVPIEDYDSLNVRQVTDRLGKLSIEEIERLRDYEAEKKNRKTLERAFETRIEAMRQAGSDKASIRAEMEEVEEQCVNFGGSDTGPGPNPRKKQGSRFLVRDHNGAPATETHVDSEGLDCGWELEITLPNPASSVKVTLAQHAAPATVQALAADGAIVDTAEMPPGLPATLELTGAAIARVLVRPPGNEAYLQEICHRVPVATRGRCCDIIAEPDEARDRSIILHYLETLQQWGDALVCRNAPEAFQQARLVFDTQARILGDHPRSVLVKPDPSAQERTVDSFVPECPPLNPRLLIMYDLVDDRRALIHACLNERRLRNGRPNVDMSYWGDSPVRAGWQSVADTCADEEDWCACCHTPYRYSFLIQKALEIAGDVRALGAALLAAFEKGDAEYLAALRASHERQLLDLGLELRENQWRAADWQVQALQKTKEGAQTRRRYYDKLVRDGLIAGEQQYQNLTSTALGLQADGRANQAFAQALGLIPDQYVGFPSSFVHLPIGSKLASVFSTIASISDSRAGSNNLTASERLTEGGWVRREAEWLHQIEVIDIEIEQIERQILAAERQRDVALRELNNHQRQMEHAAEVHDFLRDKFTNAELCLWLQQETAALYYQMYELARHTARQAQHAFNFERGYTARTFLPAEAWDDLHEGLLAGERLQLSLRQMERAYLCENTREYELTKHISLRLHFPLEFLRLKATGRCEIEVPEWMFDSDYPGHYLRRLKNVTLTLPAVVGPYTGVHCRLTLLSSLTRVQPYLIDDPAGCCDSEGSRNGHKRATSVQPYLEHSARCRDDDEPHQGYETVPDDPRIVRHYAATEAIATSSGQNDSGMFELSFNDERYLPFEFQGAVSRWRIELPQENNQFDVDTLSDVVLHLNYTAREGGDVLRTAANEVAQRHLPGAGVRFFDFRHEFPDAWHRFHNPHPDGHSKRHLDVRMERDMFPFIPGRHIVRINRLDLFFRAPGTKPSTHQEVEFVIPYRDRYGEGDEAEVERRTITCVASAEWPDLYHGVLDLERHPIAVHGERYQVGTFRFADHTGHVSQAFLFCGYETKRARGVHG